MLQLFHRERERGGGGRGGGGRERKRERELILRGQGNRLDVFYAFKASP